MISQYPHIFITVFENSIDLLCKRLVIISSYSPHNKLYLKILTHGPHTFIFQNKIASSGKNVFQLFSRMVSNSSVKSAKLTSVWGFIWSATPHSFSNWRSRAFRFCSMSAGPYLLWFSLWVCLRPWALYFEGFLRTPAKSWSIHFQSELSAN